MKLTTAMKIAKCLYTLCFLLTAAGLMAELVHTALSKVFYAAALGLLLAYVILSVAYLHCPKCGHIIHAKPFRKQSQCPVCGEPFEPFK